MKENKKVYGFGAAKRGDDRLDPTLFDTASNYFKEHPDRWVEGNNVEFIGMDEKLDVQSQGHCEFYTGWEIGDLNFFRSSVFLDFFEYLDQSGGFYSELWLSAPVRTVATSLLLPQDKLHWFSDVGFQTPEEDNFGVCPLEFEVRMENKCSCNPRKSVSWNPRKYCMHKYFLVNNMQRPEGWKEAMNREVGRD